MIFETTESLRRMLLNNGETSLAQENEHDIDDAVWAAQYEAAVHRNADASPERVLDIAAFVCLTLDKPTEFGSPIIAPVQMPMDVGRIVAELQKISSAVVAIRDRPPVLVPVAVAIPEVTVLAEGLGGLNTALKELRDKSQESLTLPQIDTLSGKVAELHDVATAIRDKATPASIVPSWPRAPVVVTWLLILLDVIIHAIK